MKKFSIIAGVVTATLVISSCRIGNKDAGKVYMPDMAYSRAYETYVELDSSKFTNDPAEAGNKIFYNRKPVTGAVARGEMGAFPFSMDKPGDTTNYVASKNYPNPLPALGEEDKIEANRLYLINCGICHGDKLDGNGPLYNGGDGPYAAAPRNLISDPIATNMPDGQMFYSITYGKNAMGSYASQLSSKQRWMIVHYIKDKQSLNKKPAAESTTTK